MRHKWMCLLVIVLAVFAGCGKDGVPGNAYISVWLETLDASEVSVMSTYALPGIYYYGTVTGGVVSSAYPPAYLLEPGSYSFHYQIRYWSGSWYASDIYGTLTITVEDGTQGSFPFQNGADGADTYYDWVLGWYGSHLYYTVSRSAAGPLAQQPAARSMTNSRSQGALQPPDPLLYDAGPTRTVSRSAGGYRITIEERPYTLKGQPQPKSKAEAAAASK